jgi:hypothetical protein
MNNGSERCGSGHDLISSTILASACRYLWKSYCTTGQSKSLARFKLETSQINYYILKNKSATLVNILQLGCSCISRGGARCAKRAYYWPTSIRGYFVTMVCSPCVPLNSMESNTNITIILSVCGILHSCLFYLCGLVIRSILWCEFSIGLSIPTGLFCWFYKLTSVKGEGKLFSAQDIMTNMDSRSTVPLLLILSTKRNTSGQPHILATYPWDSTTW